MAKITRKSIIEIAKEDFGNKFSENGINITENLIQKEDLNNEYEKLSISIPSALFETLQDIARERRRAKQKHTMSHIVREAINLWLENRNQNEKFTVVNK